MFHDKCPHSVSVTADTPGKRDVHTSPWLLLKGDIEFNFSTEDKFHGPD